MTGASTEFVRFPPRWRNVLVPTGPPRATALGVTLYTASRPLPWIAQNALWALARVGGGRALPGERESWTLPLDPDVAEALQHEWVALVGREPDAVAVYQRTQASRAALTLLMCAGRNSVLVRVRRDPDSLQQERRISEAAARLRPRAIRVPELAGAGETAGWHWTAYAAIGSRPHRPVYRLPDGAADEIAGLVEAVVPRPAGLAAGWTAAHLDVSPWNLRRVNRQTWLIDWEDAGWAPPHADEVYLAAVVSAMRGGRTRPSPVVAANPDTAAYWAAIVADRVVNDNETRLRDGTLAALRTSFAT